MGHRRILVVLADPEAAHQPALERARQLLERDAEQVELFTCVYNQYLGGYAAGGAGELERLRDGLVRERLQALVRHRDSLGGGELAVSVAALWDYPQFEGVVRRALEFNADLVVTAPLSRPAGRRPMRGSDWQLIAACPVPLLFVKGDGETPYGHVVAAVDPLHAQDRPAALDERIVTEAAAVARRLHAGLQVIHCFSPLIPPGDGPPLPVDLLEERVESDYRAALASLAARTGVDPACAVLLPGDAPEVLAARVAGGVADLIVMGAVSRGRLRDFILGSTAESVAAEVDADILFVKPENYADHVAGRFSRPSTR